MTTAKQNSKAKNDSKTANRSSSSHDESTAEHKYSPEAESYVGQEMKAMKQGQLKSGGSGKSVKNPKQAIAIGLSEAQRAGKKVPAPPRKKAA